MSVTMTVSHLMCQVTEMSQSSSNFPSYTITEAGSPGSKDKDPVEPAILGDLSVKREKGGILPEEKPGWLFGTPRVSRRLPGPLTKCSL